MAVPLRKTYDITRLFSIRTYVHLRRKLRVPVLNVRRAIFNTLYKRTVDTKRKE